MDATGDLASCKQVGDGLAGLLHDLGIGVDVHAAHGVVHGRHAGAQVVGGSLELVHLGAVVEVGVSASVAHLVPVLNGLHELLGIDAGSLGDFLERVALEEGAQVIAHLDLAGVSVEQAGLIHASLVPQQVSDLAGLGLDGVGDDVAAVELLNEAVALGVHEDATVVKTHVVDVEQGARHRVAGGVGLNPLHAHEASADALGHDDAVARGCHGVGGVDVLVEVGVVLQTHLNVGAEAACGQDEGLAGELVLVAIRVGGLDGGDGAAVVNDELAGAHAGVDGDAGSLGVALEGPRDLGARLALGNEGALHGVAAEEAHADEVDVVLVAQPLSRLKGAVSQNVDQVVVLVGVVAASDDVTLEELWGVLDALLLLHPVAGGSHAAAGNLRVAADAGQLLEHDDGLAGLGGSEGSGQASAARAEDDHVGVGRGGSLVHGGGVVGGRHGGLEAGLLAGVSHGVEDGHARDGGARDGIDVQGLVVNDEGQHDLLNGLDHAGHLDVVANLDVGDLATLNGDLNVDVGVLAASSGSVGAVLDLGGLGVVGEGNAGNHGGGGDGCDACASALDKAATRSGDAHNRSPFEIPLTVGGQRSVHAVLGAPR